MEKSYLPFNREEVEQIAERYPTPFYLYDERGIRDTACRLNSAFAWADFREYFAVKATPNPFILKLLCNEGLGADCSSLAELVLAERTGLSGELIMFTSNNTPACEYRKAAELGAIINLDDISHVAFLEKLGGIPDLVSCRYNPGPVRGGNAIIGEPAEAKFGFTREQLFRGYKMLTQKGAKRFGLHAMLSSNELNVEYFIETAKMLFELVVELSRDLGIRFEFVNLGGGIGIPMRPEQQPLDLDIFSRGVKDCYEGLIVRNNLSPLRIYLECGRAITGPHGYLITRCIHKKEIYKDYVGVDACMANLMRPAIYGAYHHITVLGKENEASVHKYDVCGSLCENNDKFAINRLLPEIERGDLLVIHDSGAHGHAMGFQYNGKLRSAELLLRDNREVVEIRRAETLDDYFATVDFGRLKDFA